MEDFRNGINKRGVIVQESLSGEKIFGDKKFPDTVLLFIYCPNLWANEQIPFDLQLSKDGQEERI